MTPRPRPLLGLVLGLMLGLVLVGLAWQLGGVDPGRTVLFVTVAITVLAVAGLLTRQVSAARGRFVTVAVIAGVLAGVGLTGIPELVSVGRVSEGCTLEATASGVTAAPGDTTAFTPLAVDAAETVSWTITAAEPIAVDTRIGGVRIAGFDVPVRTVVTDPLPGGTEVSGTIDVAQGLESIRERTGLELSGVYHAYGSVSGETGECVADGWFRIAPAGLIATNVLVGLWIALGVLLLLLAWTAFAVRGSFRRARAAALDAGRVHTGTVTTAAGGSLAGGAGAGYVAADAEPSGSTSPDAVTDPVPVEPAPAFTPEARAEDAPAARIEPAPAGAAEKARRDVGAGGDVSSGRARDSAKDSGGGASDGAGHGAGDASGAPDQATAAIVDDAALAEPEPPLDAEAGPEPDAEPESDAEVEAETDPNPDPDPSASSDSATDPERS